MKVQLTPSWQLSDEHAASSDGQPVLVNRVTGDVYGPMDVVQLYSSHEMTLAKIAVGRLVAISTLTDEERQVVKRFVESAQT